MYCDLAAVSLVKAGANPLLIKAKSIYNLLHLLS